MNLKQGGAISSIKQASVIVFLSTCNLSVHDYEIIK